MNPLASTLSELQSLGFLAQLDDESCQRLLEQTWGCPFSPGPEGDAMLLSLDTASCWQGDLKMEGDPAPYYRELLHRWAPLSRGSFQPEVSENPGPELFRVGDYQARFQPAPGHYLDTPGLMHIVNSHVLGLHQFEISDALGMPNLVLFIDPARRLALEQRGWKFYAQQRWGYLSSFWEQGMEEFPWRIWQCRRHCQSPTTGWGREGMHRLGEGDELEILHHDGSLLWRGCLQARRKGWFGRLRVSDPDWYPPEVASKSWQQWFEQNPPLRARLLT